MKKEAYISSFLKTIALALFVTACSGGHVTMVYEKGRNPEGTASEDRVYQLELAEGDPAKIDGIVTRLAAMTPPDFNWVNFWSSLRTRPKIFLNMKPGTRQTLMDLATKSCGVAGNAQGLDSFAAFALEMKIDFETLSLFAEKKEDQDDPCKLLSLDPTLALQVIQRKSDDIISKGVSEEASASVDWMKSFLKREMSKKDPRWALALSRDSFAVKNFQKAVSLIGLQALSDSNSAKKSELLSSLSEIESLVAEQGLPSKDLVRTPFTRSLLNGIAKNKNTKDTLDLMRDLRAQHKNLVDGREIWEESRSFPRSAWNDIVGYASDLCVAGSDVFDEENYLRFIEVLKKQTNPVQLLLNPDFPCLEEMSPRVANEVLEGILGSHLTDLAKASVELKSDPTTQVPAIRSFELIGKILKGFQKRKKSDLNIFLASPKSIALLKSLFSIVLSQKNSELGMKTVESMAAVLEHAGIQLPENTRKSILPNLLKRSFDLYYSNDQLSVDLLVSVLKSSAREANTQLADSKTAKNTVWNPLSKMTDKIDVKRLSQKLVEVLPNMLGDIDSNNNWLTNYVEMRKLTHFMSLSGLGAEDFLAVNRELENTILMILRQIIGRKPEMIGLLKYAFETKLQHVEKNSLQAIEVATLQLNVLREVPQKMMKIEEKDFRLDHVILNSIPSLLWALKGDSYFLQKEQAKISNTRSQSTETFVAAQRSLVNKMNDYASIFAQLRKYEKVTSSPEGFITLELEFALPSLKVSGFYQKLLNKHGAYVLYLPNEDKDNKETRDLFISMMNGVLPELRGKISKDLVIGITDSPRTLKNAVFFMPHYEKTMPLPELSTEE